MFAIAARYDQAELPPLDPGNLWEAGLEYMVQAREVLSMLPSFLSGDLTICLHLQDRVYHYCRGTTCQALLLLGLREFGIGALPHM
jgi:hypothetical protein